jgi:hypothetical protein
MIRLLGAHPTLPLAGTLPRGTMLVRIFFVKHRRIATTLEQQIELLTSHLAVKH